MIKKDIDFGLKEIDINQYKLKKNNTGKTALILILILCFFYFSYNLDKLNFSEKSIVENDEKEILAFSAVENNNFFPLKDSLVEMENNENPEQLSNNTDNNSPKIKDINFLSGKYYIISGSFSNYNLSLNKANFLNDNGFNAFIISPVNQNKMFRVAVDVYDDIDTAKENLKSYKEKLNNELWILKY